jgi:predicted amidohydrolase
MILNRAFSSLLLVLVVLSGAMSASAQEPADYVQRANQPPRKVVVAAALASFTGSLHERLHLATRLIDDAAQEADRQGLSVLDLVVLPEFALGQNDSAVATERAVALHEGVSEALGAKAREHRAWLVVPMTLHEPEPERAGQISNAAVLFDRTGAVAGIFRKGYPIRDADGRFEGGVTPGDAFPVFDCDFGQLGILICWDMAYERSWRELARGGAEIVAVPSASPQTLRPLAEALRHRYHVLTSTPRNNASLFNPIGQTIAQVTRAPGVLVHEIDLSYAVLHWSEGLENGAALTRRFGGAVGHTYSDREDTGVFWSNDPKRPIGEMMRELGLIDLEAAIEHHGARAATR